jgi:DNA-binding beta-propeller fold protein YncE
VVGTIGVGNPASVAIDSANGTAYVANESDGTVSVIDEAAGIVVSGLTS